MKLIGILGGMGPQATVLLMQRVLDFTPVTGDADHIPLLACNDPRIPDRTAAILGKGPTPVPALTAAGRRLEAAGAELLVIPCNTAHYFLPALRKALRLPFLDLIEEVAVEVAALVPPGSAIGVLATDGTLMTGLYRDRLATCGLHEMAPDPDEQQAVMSSIYGPYGIKVTGPTLKHAQTLGRIVHSLHKRGAQAVIAGCTEIPLAFSTYPDPMPVPVVSSTDVLARAIVRETGRPVSPATAPALSVSC